MRHAIPQLHHRNALVSVELLALGDVFRMRRKEFYHASVQPVVIVGTFCRKMLGQESDLAPNHTTGDAVDCKDILFLPPVLICQPLPDNFYLRIDFELGTTAVVLVAAPISVLLSDAHNFNHAPG